MMPRDIRAYLFDFIEACKLLRQFTVGKTFAAYKSDAMLRSAVERQFEIIGEALNQALRLDPGLTTRISHTGRIIAFRNRLIHVYASIADEVVWGILEKNLRHWSRRWKHCFEKLRDTGHEKQCEHRGSGMPSSLAQ
jgi:uncharacterized protein with HEPN domain